MTFDDKLATTLDDMAETMYKAEGVGLAAPQIGILRRYCVVDVGDGIIELVNPVIESMSGEQTGEEGCLSIPNRYERNKTDDGHRPRAGQKREQLYHNRRGL